MPDVLYLHGRGDNFYDAPGDLVATVCRSLTAPRLDDGFFRTDFATQVFNTNAWMEGVDLAIGHSYGCWLLLCAALERLDTGYPTPHCLLMSSLFGYAEGGQVRHFLPRCDPVQSALGLKPDAPPAFPIERMTFIHGDLDDPVSVVNASALRRKGFDVRLLTGAGHRLLGTKSRTQVMHLIREHLVRTASDKPPTDI